MVHVARIDQWQAILFEETGLQISSLSFPLQDTNGVTRYDGHHTKGEQDGKWITWKSYDYNFTGLELKQIRVAPNAMDALMACKAAFNLDK